MIKGGGLVFLLFFCRTQAGVYTMLHFSCVILVDGGNGNRSLQGPKEGGYLFAAWGETSANAGRTAAAAKMGKNMQVQTYVMIDSGHTFHPAGKEAVKTWRNETVIPATLGEK